MQASRWQLDKGCPSVKEEQAVTSPRRGHGNPSNACGLMKTGASALLAKEDGVKEATPLIMDSKTTRSYLELQFRRLTPTLEAAMSKVFFGAFAWQGFAYIAKGMGVGSETASYAFFVGLGDAVGVVLSHTALVLLRAAVRCALSYKERSSRYDIIKGFVVGLWMSSAGFMSGTIWQPMLNLTEPELLFTWAALLTGITSALGFFLLLRAGREVYARVLGLHAWMTYGNWDNLRFDASL